MRKIDNMSSPAETIPPKPYTLKTILRFKPFRTLWLAQFVSVFGDFLALFGVISLITFRWHGTAVQVTTITIAYILPLAIIGPVAGVFVDHWNVKRLMIASDLIRAVLILMLVFVHDVTQISVIFLLMSAVSSFFMPAQSVTIRTVVPPEGLLAANAMMAQAFYVVRLLSPAAAGALVAWLTEKSCFYLDVVSFVFSAAMIRAGHCLCVDSSANHVAAGNASGHGGPRKQHFHVVDLPFPGVRAAALRLSCAKARHPFSVYGLRRRACLDFRHWIPDNAWPPCRA
jgi:MFS family permease